MSSRAGRGEGMTRDEMLAQTELAMRMAQGIDAALSFPDSVDLKALAGAVRGLVKRLKATHVTLTLSSPCACGGRKPIAKAKGAVWVWPTGPPYLYKIDSGNLELVPGLGADAGGHLQQVDLLVFEALPAEAGRE